MREHTFLNKLALVVFIVAASPAMANQTCRDLFAGPAIPPDGGAELVLYLKYSESDLKAILSDSPNAVPPLFFRDLDSLRNAPRGTKLDFGDGDVFYLDKFLGEGGTTKIVRVTTGQVLRIYNHNPGANPGSSLTKFVKLQQELERAGVPVVRIDLENSRLPKFLVVEEKKIRYTLESFLNHANDLPSDERRLALERLHDFARKTWAFTYIGDFNGSQMGYDGHEWFLFDVGSTHRHLQNHGELQTTFSTSVDADGTIRHVPEDLEKSLEAVIHEERESQFASGQFKDLAPLFKRDGLGEKDYRGLFAGDQELRISMPPITRKLLTDFGKSLFKRPKWTTNDDLELKLGSHARTGKKSVIYTARVSSSGLDKRIKTLIEVRLKIDGKDDLFAGKMPLLKSMGYGKKDILVIGPDYVIVRYDKHNANH